MPVTYYTTTSTQTFTPFAVNLQLTRTLGSSQTITLDVPTSSTRTYGWASPSADPGTDGTSTGDFTLEFNITTADSNLSITTLSLHRFNSAGVQQAVDSTHDAGPTLPESLGSTGVRTFTFTNPGLGTWASGDRYVLSISINNSSMHVAGVAVLTVNTTDAEIVTPFSAGVIPSLVFPRKDRRHLALRSFDRWTVTGWR